eukprot:GHVO01014273.1.p1 GENE.GHVO01014273.1~~GHVO01014273.1.p1  ORF type:complete len:241 (-),score=33.05 GHVO01014273.1:244-966(-)
MLSYLENAAVNRVSAYISDLDVGDRILKGLINLFSVSEKRKGDKLLHTRLINELEALQCGSSEGDSSLIGETVEESADILIKLFDAMNLSYPDYDFSTASAKNFSKEPDFGYVFSNINYQLSFLAEKQDPGFVKELWDALQGSLELPASDIYSYRREGDDCEADDGEESSGYLFAFDYFFMDKSLHRLLYFSCVTRQKVRVELPTSPCDDTAEEEELPTDTEEITVVTTDTDKYLASPVE